MISGFEAGGQLMITSDVENYPGFAEPIQGPWLMEQMKAQAEHFGARMISDHIVKVELDRHPFRITGDSGEAYICDTLVIATGAKAQWLGSSSEAKFKGYGVSAAPPATGSSIAARRSSLSAAAIRRSRRLSISAISPARSRWCIEAPPSGAERILQERLFKRPNVEIIWDHVIDEIRGTDNPPSVTEVSLKHVKTGALRNHETQWRFRRDRT